MKDLRFIVQSKNSSLHRGQVTNISKFGFQDLKHSSCGRLKSGALCLLQFIVSVLYALTFKKIYQED
ncbi:hypothetical protein HYPSUDRAFT_672238 [Hypholoma sublateritium FD-334 SS-4]|uniref:Uncharacterized protein n=1 Tax=Hypholoma sublateritium (strain FD-334 SS-4) TaxID=945553 RepID=A0A0D2L568_HYPSF|nr:hypothetical protein HYPSUDRAFT_672238 [Hypholoma sublateritium FD-334 SS-4]